MKLRSLYFYMLAFLFNNHAIADDCDIRASAVDLRDRALIFNPTLRQTLRGPDGGPECDIRMLATNLANPRSKIIQDFVSEINSYSQTMMISQISLQGQGTLKFMSVDFGYGQNQYRLDLHIAPGIIPKGSTTSSNYYLSGFWLAFDNEGSLIQESAAFFPRVIADYQTIFLNWDSLALKTKVELVVGNLVVPIRNYGFGGTYDVNSPFFPVSKTVGSLAATSLMSQTSFLLRSGSTCGREGVQVPVSCD